MTDLEHQPRSYHHGDLRRALIDAALALLAEEGGWSFSIRALARRAGVSHSAPNKHFPTKRDLLTAVAGVGFDMLRERMLAESARVEPADLALAATGVAYVRFAVEHPALYRLMFGPELAGEAMPDEAEAAGIGAKLVIEDAILHAAKAGLLRFSADDQHARSVAALTCWSAVHGLAMLLIEGKAPASSSAGMLAGAMVANLMTGLRRQAS